MKKTLENGSDSVDQSEAPERHFSILVVEDHPANMFVARTILESLGHGVEMAENGLTGLQAVRDKLYDLVLMDIRMPVMDGITATRYIRELSGENGRIPIIAMTAYAMAGDQEMFLAAGMDDYIAKPVEIETLAAKVNKWRGHRSAHGRAQSLSAAGAETF